MSDQDSYICNICQKDYVGPLNLEIHKRVHSKGESQLENQSVNEKRPCEEKKVSKELTKQFFECETCEETLQFTKLSQLKVHEKRCHTEKKDSIKRTRKVKGDVKKVTHEKLVFECDTCEKKFVKLGELKTHMKSHIVKQNIKKCKPKENFICDECQKTFASRSKLSTHKQNSVCENLYKCKFNKCSSVFDNIKGLIKHIKDLHEDLRTDAKNSNLENILPAQEIGKKDKLNEENVYSSKLLCWEQKLPKNSISKLFDLNIERLKSQTGHKNFSILKNFDLKMAFEFKCSFCHQYSKGHEEMKVHLSQCNEINRIKEDVSKTEDHLPVKSRFQCCYCNSNYAQEIKLDIHVKQKHARNSIEPEYKSKKRSNQDISNDEKKTTNLPAQEIDEKDKFRQ